MADDAGALLVRSGLVTTKALDKARVRAEDQGGTIGEQLVISGAIGDDTLTEFYRSRLLVPQVNPNTLARLPVRVIAALPSDMAIELRAIPVALDGENNLTVAMSDPSDRHAVDEIAFFTGAYVVRAVATQMQIAWCLAHYYSHVTALGQRLLQATGAEAVHPVSAPRPRTKGLTGQVNAQRHRAIAPVTGPVNIVRPQANSTPPVAEVARVAVAEPPIRAVSEPVEPVADGVPVHRPRARSVSGEIRVPRAASIRPPMPDPDEESGPVITVEAAPMDEDATGPRKVAPRRRVVKSDPPELAARAGEVELLSGPARSLDAEEPRIIIAADALGGNDIQDASGEFRSAPPRPASSGVPTQTIEVSDEASAAVVIHEHLDAESQPIMLERRRASDAPATHPDPSTIDVDHDVVVLETKKPRSGRREKHTQVGIVPQAVTPRSARDTEAGLGGLGDSDEPTELDHMTAPPGPEDTTDETAAPPPPREDDTGRIAAPPAPRTASGELRGSIEPSYRVVDDDDDGDDDDGDDGEPRGRATMVMSAVELDAAIPQRSSEVVPAHLAARELAHDEVDDGWGPPGTTIPPPLLGAVPGSDVDDDDEDVAPGRIPVSSGAGAPLIVAPPSPPEHARATSTADTGQTEVHALEHASARLLELIRALEAANERDEVVDVMIDHLAETHRRAGFFVVKPGLAKGTTELSLFALEPPPEIWPSMSLRLDQPSTLQDVVGTRLPYRGPMHDETSRGFLAGVLGEAPTEILLVPVAVRERVVGVLFGEHRLRHMFDDQLALASRVAGIALERILVAKRG